MTKLKSKPKRRMLASVIIRYWFTIYMGALVPVWIRSSLVVASVDPLF
jgi:hypothetical protein